MPRPPRAGQAPVLPALATSQRGPLRDGGRPAPTPAPPRQLLPCSLPRRRRGATGQRAQCGRRGDVIGIDLFDFPPLVRHADLDNLLFDDAFDLALSDDPAVLTCALFPSSYTAEIERTVRRGSTIALAVDPLTDLFIIVSLFKMSS